jgi:hypothetical protein
MGFRFRKSINLLPGIKLNISKSGLSTTIGKPGARINISGRGTRGTIGIPGTGVSYSENLSSTSSSHSTQQAMESQSPKAGVGFGGLLVWGVVAFVAVTLLYGVLNR